MASWRPVPQPPCTEPCCTGEANLPTPSVVVIRDENLRVCGVTGCTWCPPVNDHSPDPVPGGGDRLPKGPR